MVAAVQLYHLSGAGLRSYHIHTANLLHAVLDQHAEPQLVGNNAAVETMDFNGTAISRHVSAGEIIGPKEWP